MSNNENARIIYCTATSGPALSICSYCRKIVGKTTVLLSIAAYHQVGDNEQQAPEILSIPFEPVEYCQCIEKMLMGAKYE